MTLNEDDSKKADRPNIVFPNEPRWSQELPMPRQADTELPDSVKEMLFTLDQLKENVKTGAVNGFMIFAENTEGGFSFFYTTTEDVFSRYGAIIGYSQKKLIEHLATHGQEGK